MTLSEIRQRIEKNEVIDYKVFEKQYLGGDREDKSSLKVKEVFAKMQVQFYQGFKEGQKSLLNEISPLVIEKEKLKDLHLGIVVGSKENKGDVLAMIMEPTNEGNKEFEIQNILFSKNVTEDLKEHFIEREKIREEKDEILEKAKDLVSSVKSIHSRNTHEDGFGFTNSSGEQEVLDAIQEVENFEEELKSKLGVKE